MWSTTSSRIKRSKSKLPVPNLPNLSSALNFDDGLFPTVDLDEQIQVLHKLKREYDELVQQWAKDYIWQKESFELKLYQPGVDPAMQKKGGKRALLPTPLPTTSA